MGNLPFDINDADLMTVFGVAGKVLSAHVILNQKTGGSKGYGFVEMETEALAVETVKKFEGATLNERAITVQIAAPKPEKKSEKKSEKKPEKNSEKRSDRKLDSPVQSVSPEPLPVDAPPPAPETV